MPQGMAKGAGFQIGGPRLFFCKIKPLHGSGGEGYYGLATNGSVVSARLFGVSLLVSMLPS